MTMRCSVGADDDPSGPEYPAIVSTGKLERCRFNYTPLKLGSICPFQWMFHFFFLRRPNRSLDAVDRVIFIPCTNGNLEVTSGVFLKKFHLKTWTCGPRSVADSFSSCSTFQKWTDKYLLTKLDTSKSCKHDIQKLVWASVLLLLFIFPFPPA